MKRRLHSSFYYFVVLLAIQHCAQSQQQECDPCASSEGVTKFVIKPGTGCKEYVQCISGQNMGYFECSGDTLFDQSSQYCNWPSSVTCVETTCPPTKEPTTGQPTMPESDCPNPCSPGFTGFQTRPSTKCQKYVSCVDGKVSEELECAGETIFNGLFCDWPGSNSCSFITCPERELTDLPTQSPVSAACREDAVMSEARDCPNPCSPGYSGFQAKPGTQCSKYVQCDNGEVVGDLVCPDDTTFSLIGQYCEPSSETLCCLTPCPERVPTTTPTVKPVGEEESEPTPSPAAAISDLIPTSENGSGSQDDSSEPVSQQPSMQSSEDTGSPSTTFLIDPTLNLTLTKRTDPPTKQPTSRPTRPPRTPKPTTQRPTPEPTPTYQNFRTYLLAREDMIESVVLQSNGSPSTAYTFPDFINSLDTAVFQVPADKAFFVGLVPGRLPKLTGVEYGLVNMAAFLSNAMEEGIKIDSCDEWNTDFMYDNMREKYPLSNGCGQYGRSYEDEKCPDNEPFQCAPVDKSMEVTAADGNAFMKAPPFTCRAKEYNGEQVIYPGYYDSVDNVVIQTAYANSNGRTDLEGCCWWGRGVLLTRGRCSIGKLDKYLGQAATEREIFVYPDINFCTDPGAICNHERTNELRWVLGLLEWSDRVQSYVDPKSGWSYIDELKKFVDEGMVDDEFINGVINIFTRQCHDDSCEDQWHLDDENNVFEATRRANFRKIIFEVFNLPMTYRPTQNPTLYPSWPPTINPTITASPTTSPTRRPTSRPTRAKKVIIGLEDNGGTPLALSKCICLLFCLCIAMLFGFR